MAINLLLLLFFSPLGPTILIGHDLELNSFVILQAKASDIQTNDMLLLALYSYKFLYRSVYPPIYNSSYVRSHKESQLANFTLKFFFSVCCKFLSVLSTLWIKLDSESALPAKVLCEELVYQVVIPFDLLVLPLHLQSLFAAPIVGHVGDGNVHCVFMVDPNSDQSLARAKYYSHILGV